MICDAAESSFFLHGGIGGDDAIDVGERDEAVGSEPRVAKFRVGVAGGANQLAGVVDFHQASGSTDGAGIHACVRVLEADEHVTVGKAQIGVRVHVAGHVGEGCCDGGMQRIVEIEDEGAAGVVIVGEEHGAFGHGVFGVMDAESCLVGGEGGEELTVVRRRRVGVDYGEEVFGSEGAVTGPDEEVMTGLGLWFGGGERRDDEANDDCCDWKETAHVSSRVMRHRMAGRIAGSGSTR